MLGFERMNPDYRDNDLREVIRLLDEWGRAHDWTGPDPYEGLNARRVPAAVTRSALGRRLLIQAVKRSPLDLRGPLGIEPRPDSASLAHVLSAYARMGRAGLLAGDQGSRRAQALVERLSELRVHRFPEAAWGYHFDVETRFFFYAATTPNTIATAFTGLALLEADSAFGTPGAGELAEGAGEFFLRRVPQTAGSEGAYFGYLPDDRTPIHNANLLACALLTALARRTGRTDFERAARQGVAYARAHQRPDGSWPYAEDPRGGWVDGFHTGYVLDALATCAQGLDDRAAEEAYVLGLDFYARHLFADERVPKFLVDSTYPVDGQCVAQAIRTFSIAAELESDWLARAAAVFGYAVAEMDRDDGAFAFQRHRLWVDRTPHVRWVQAPMLEALSVLYEAAGDDDLAAGEAKAKAVR